MKKNRKKKLLKIIKYCVVLPLFLFVALPYWILPAIVDFIVRTEMLEAGLEQPTLNTKHVTLFSTKITDISFETNGIKVECPEIVAKYSIFSLLKKEINSLSIAESYADLDSVLPAELKEKLYSTKTNLKLNLANKDKHYVGKLTGDILKGSFFCDLDFDIEKGCLSINGNINTILKDKFPSPKFIVNYVVSDCYSDTIKGTGELVIPETNLKLGTDLFVKDEIINITTTLNSVVSKTDPYLERLFARIDKENVIKTLYTEVYSKLSIKLALDASLPAWDLLIRLNEFKTNIALEDNNELQVDKGMVSIHLSGLGGKWVLHSIPIYVNNINIGNLNLTNGFFKILADEEQLLLSEGHINAFGGTLSIYALYLNFNHLNAGFTIFIDDIKLNEIITALPKLEGTGSGSLHGKLPISIYRGKMLKLHDAYLLSTPGVVGKLELTDTTLLQEALLTSGVPEQTCSDLGKALVDLDYSVIRLELIDSNTSDQSLLLQINGKSIQKKHDIPVELNVRIHGGIESLLNIGLRSQGILR